MIPVFDPQDSSCKTPFGAAKCGAPVENEAEEAPEEDVLETDDLRKLDAVEEQKTDAVEDTAPVQAEEPKAPAESEYTIEELADGAGNIFKVQRECVVAALKVAGVTTCTVSKAKELVDAFMKKEVK